MNSTYTIMADDALDKLYIIVTTLRVPSTLKAVNLIALGVKRSPEVVKIQKN
jgi:hypothetical protein